MRKIHILLLAVLFINCNSKKPESKTTTIAFGSCVKEYLDAPIFNDIVNDNPDIFVWLGDMVYGDTENMDTLESKYNRLLQKPEYQNLVRSTPIIGVWDDHDYGVNDGNKYYPKKAESKLLALDFLDAPKTDERYKRNGLYSSHRIESNGKIIKIILLDTRYFQDSLSRDTKTRNKYLINKSGDILGNKQWEWLEEELKDTKMDLCIIGSGIQFIAKDHYYEKWANFPTARNKMFELLKVNNNKPVLFISGDRHIAEISQIEIEGNINPLFDFTASGLTHTWKGYFDEPNEYRIKDLIAKKNYGLIQIDWINDTPKVTFEVKGEQGQHFLSHTYTYITN